MILHNIMTDQVLNNTIMTLKSGTLKGPRPTQGKLSTIVITHIRHIEQKIREADTNNKTYIDYKIESDFQDVQGMLNSEVQIFVYSKIIEDLTACDYDVYFRNVPDDYTFYIKWGSPMARLELDNRKKILRIASYKYQNKKNQIHTKNSQKFHNIKMADDTIRGLSRQIGLDREKPRKGVLLRRHPEQGVLDYKFHQSDSDDPVGIVDSDGEDWSSYLGTS